MIERTTRISTTNRKQSDLEIEGDQAPNDALTSSDHYLDRKEKTTRAILA